MLHKEQAEAMKGYDGRTPIGWAGTPTVRSNESRVFTARERVDNSDATNDNDQRQKHNTQ